MTETTLPGPRVPQMRTTVVGESYGGQYWDREEYAVTLDAPDDPANLEGPFVLRLLTLSDHVVDTVTLTRDQALQIRSVTTAGEGLVDGLPGIARVTTWTLGRDLADHVTLNEGELTEIGAWLEYALGLKDWDYTANGDEWEY